jgi:hypothetical protein
MKQIVVALEGGLGNQMFQYAAGRALALRTGASLALDVRPLLRHGQRSYGLGDFQLSPDLELLTVGSPLRVGRLRRLFRRLTGGEQTFREASFAYDERISSAAAPIRLEGYFQSERYFATVADELRKDFLPRPALLTEIDALAARLLPSDPCVSLHVRRGDYANPATMAVHGLMEPEYYERALRAVTERVGQVTVCVFTDEPAWVRANLRLPAETRFVSEHTRTALQDLVLMSRCTHHITANSSFSWWGAWLNPRPDKMVITPARWFQPAAGLDARDLRPAGWLKA